MGRFGLAITKLCKTFTAGRNHKVQALLDFSLEARPGEFVVIVGANGAGKSTVLNLIWGDYSPDSGSIFLSGSEGRIELTDAPRWERARYIGRVYQDIKLGTVGGLTVLENIHLASMVDRIPSPVTLGRNRYSRAEYLEQLAFIGLREKVDDQVADLSQGLRQTLAVELALQRKPSVLLLDEHTASLDVENARKCLNNTQELCRKTGTTIVMVTHNLADAISYGDRIVVLREGKIAANVANGDKKSLGIADLYALCGYS